MLTKYGVDPATAEIAQLAHPILSPLSPHSIPTTHQPKAPPSPCAAGQRVDGSAIRPGPCLRILSDQANALVLRLGRFPNRQPAVTRFPLSLEFLEALSRTSVACQAQPVDEVQRTVRPVIVQMVLVRSKDQLGEIDEAAALARAR